MLTSIQATFRRHQRKLYWVGAITGGAWLLGKFAKAKFIELQEQAVLDRNAKENIKRRFEQNQQDCSFTVLALLPTVGDQIFTELNVEKLTAILQHKKQKEKEDSTANDQSQNDEDNTVDEETKKYEAMPKLQLWNELKIQTFTRLFLSIYIITLLTLFTRIQLNLLGRFIYLDSILSFNQKQSSPSDDEHKPKSPTNRFISYDIERKYLTFSWYILNAGWRKLMERVKDAVEDVIGGLHLKKQMTYDDLKVIFNEIRTRIEYENWNSVNPTPHKFTQYLLPGELEELDILHKGGVLQAENESEREGTSLSGRVPEKQLRELLDETRDLFDHPDLPTVLSNSFDSLFSLLYHHFTATFYPSLLTPATLHPSQAQAQPKIKEIEESKSIPLAALLPILKKEVHTVLHGVPNEFVMTLASVNHLNQFSAIVYAAFDQETAE
ncbi:Peroxin-3 [Paraphysoderma sedebokerense]|nr:Peroxin-3 [Paraphysoderma sedebokerense]